jgi:hypothetical protein
MDAEQVHQVYWVGGLPGLVQHAVAPHLARSDSGAVEGAAQCAVADGWKGGVVGRVRRDQQVRVGGCGPLVVPLQEPVVQGRWVSESR